MAEPAPAQAQAPAQGSSGLQPLLLRKAIMLSVSRLTDWCAVAFMSKVLNEVPNYKAFRLALGVSIALSTLCCYVVLKADADRRSCLPAAVVALSQVGALLELCPASPASPPQQRSQSFEMQDHGRVSFTASWLATSSTSLGSLRASSFRSEAVLSPVKVAELRLRILRKMTLAQAPEALVSTALSLWLLVSFAKEIYWQPFTFCSDSALLGSDAAQFDLLFWRSPHGIIRRTCRKCKESHQEVFYRRLDGKRDFKPYLYMRSNWSSVQNRLHKDFDLFSTYEDALTEWHPWEYCSFDKSQGFPGECGPHGPVLDQWSALNDLGEQVGPKHGRFAIERIVKPGNIPLILRSLSLNQVVPCVLAGCMATLSLAAVFADIVISFWIQSDFVQEHPKLVTGFYWLDICSWWPVMLLVYNEYGFWEAIDFITVDTLMIATLVFLGFYKGRQRATLRQQIMHRVFQALLALSVAPFLVLVNFVFFDKSLTFQPLNKWYYPLRFVCTAILLVVVPFVSSDTFINPAVHFSMLTSLLLAGMVWGYVPRLRRLRETRTALEFAKKALTANEANASEPPSSPHSEEGELGHFDATRRRTTVTSRASIFPPAPKDGIVQVLNAVGDIFEALLLASSADSPRVRCAVLGVAVKPLTEAGPTLLSQLLPLILPQLLLALRWRTVEDGKDEHCPLSSFLLDRALGERDNRLITLVYWQLLALSTDRSSPACATYRAVRMRLLAALQCHSFRGSSYDEEFCTEALALIANQRRLYFQLRMVARMAGKVGGSHTEKTSILRSALVRLHVRRQRSEHGGAPRQSVFSVRAISSQLPASRRPASPRPRRRFWTLLWKRQRTATADVVREEWEHDSILEEYENTSMDLMEPCGTPLPVAPTEGLAAVDPQRSFVAHSAVAPVVLACRLAGQGEEPEANTFRLYAMKMGDDLRQDALVLQIFSLMETAWAEHGLEDLALRPYNVLAVSPQEGMVAFVPHAMKVSSILLEHEGDVREFLARAGGDVDDALDRLCGSTAAYCVATYVLGVGDRHLDNLMITEEGHFFHIDFGFVLGDDPKPGAPVVRVPREVIEAIRLTGRYEHFRFLVGEAFLLLRRTARLWNALLALAASAGGNGVSVLQQHAERGINVVRERLHLELDEAAARSEIVAEVEECAVAMVPIIYDKLHQAGLFWN